MLIELYMLPPVSQDLLAYCVDSVSATTHNVGRFVAGFQNLDGEGRRDVLHGDPIHHDDLVPGPEGVAQVRKLRAAPIPWPFLGVPRVILSRCFAFSVLPSGVFSLCLCVSLCLFLPPSITHGSVHRIPGTLLAAFLFQFPAILPWGSALPLGPGSVRDRRPW